MGQIWTDESRLQIWMEIELCALEAMAAQSLVPAEVAPRLRAAQWQITDEDVTEVDKIEQETRHDVIAFLTHLERRMGPDARYLHMGMTSSDVLDTTLAVQLDRAAKILLKDLDDLIGATKDQAYKHRDTIMVGRTHGIHAEPTTLGLVFALWYQELVRQRVRLEAARATVAVGKLSGAVGTFAHLPLEVEAEVCRRLNLSPAPVSNQVVQRDRHAEFFCALANLGATLEKMAVNIRHFMRTEVGEVAESFKKGQRGSSAMPHKKNPIGSENLTGVARLLRSFAMAALENVALWHERDISHSSVERVIAPDATILADYAMARMTGIIRDLWVDPDRMQANLDLTRGSIFSQTVLLKMVRAGLEREKAYEMVQRNALKSMDTGASLEEMLLEDQEVVEALGEEAIRSCFDPRNLVARAGELFARVFGE
jgi:adenylosuccinate lyase